MKTKNVKCSPAKLTVAVCIIALAATSVGFMYLYGMVRWQPLWLVAVLQLLPAVIQLALLLPVREMPEAFGAEMPESKKEKRRYR